MDQGEEPESQMAGQRATYLEENCSETYMANWGAIDGKAACNIVGGKLFRDIFGKLGGN